MSEKSGGIDTYATRHCPVCVYKGDQLIKEYASISDCAKEYNITPAKVKHYLYYSEQYNGLEFDIPASSIYEAKLETFVRKRGFKNVVRIYRQDRQRKTSKRYERVYLGGKMNIQPLGDNLLIEKLEERRTASGLVLLENKDFSGLTLGTVKGIGEEIFTVHPGDKILYQDSCSTEVKLEGKTMYIVSISNVFATVRE